MSPVLSCILWGRKKELHAMSWLSSVSNFLAANSAGVSSSTCHICPAAEAPDTIGTSKAYYLQMILRQLAKGTNGQERCHMAVWWRNLYIIKAVRFEVGLLKIRSSGVWCFAVGWVVFDISTDCSTFVFRTAWWAEGESSAVLQNHGNCFPIDTSPDPRRLSMTYLHHLHHMQICWLVRFF